MVKKLYMELNARLSKTWLVISNSPEPPSDAEDLIGIKNKIKHLLV